MQMNGINRYCIDQTICGIEKTGVPISDHCIGEIRTNQIPFKSSSNKLHLNKLMADFATNLSQHLNGKC